MQPWRLILALILLGCSPTRTTPNSTVADAAVQPDVSAIDAHAADAQAASPDQVDIPDTNTTSDGVDVTEVCQSTLWHKKLLAHLGVYRIVPSGSMILVAGGRSIGLEFSALARNGGALQWSTAIGFFGQTNAVVARPEGGWWTAGWDGKPAFLRRGPEHAAFIMAISSDGDDTFAGVDSDGAWWDLAASLDGSLAAGELPDGAHVTAFTSKFGSVLWDAAIPGMGAARAVLPGTPIVVVGLAEGDTSTGAGLLVANLAPDGKVLTSQQILQASDEVSVEDVVHMHGHILAIGGQVIGNEKQLVLIRIDADGQATAFALHGQNFYWREPRSGIILDDGSILATGRGYSLNDPQGPLVSRLDRFGNVLSERVIPVPFQTSHTAEAIAEDGNGLLVDTNYPAEYFVTIHRVDAWANADCETSGPCFAKAYADCADDNPCTNDLCDAQHGGCYHVPLPVGATCSDAGAHCSSSGACE